MDLEQSAGNLWTYPFRLIHKSDQGGKNLISYTSEGIDSLDFRYIPHVEYTTIFILML